MLTICLFLKNKCSRDLEHIILSCLFLIPSRVQIVVATAGKDQTGNGDADSLSLVPF